MELAGYALIDRDAKSGFTAGNMNDFLNKQVRVFEFAKDGGAMVVNNQGTAIATFDKEDIVASFKCSEHGEVVTPPDLDFMQKMAYVTKAMSRKGGYAPIVRQLVIAASLHRREFCDSVLWQKQ
tara:strand:- start:641 stop:1012 length:372 start_codon:yes stop_codon:yes gene_type:complete